MAVSTVPKVRRDGTITLTDSGASNTYTVAYEDGDFSFSRTKAARIVVRDRGVIVGVRNGDAPVMSLSFTVHLREFTNSTADVLIDVLEETGAAASWTSVSSGAFEPYMLDCKLTIEGTDHSDQADATITLSKCLFEWDVSEGDPDKVSVKAEVYGGYTVTGISA